MQRFLLVSFLAALFSLPHIARGEGVDISGSLDIQMRLFWNDPAWAGQDSNALHGSIAATTELRWRGPSSRVSLISSLRHDANDEERNLLDLKEAYWAYEGSDFDLLVGANTVFWGVTESVHLVDIISQSDLAGDIDGEDKLGQPMVSLTLQHDWGEVTLFAMPFFRERTFPGVDGRLRAPLPVDTDRPQFASSGDEKRTDVALRYSHYFGDIDIGLSAFSGTSREPRFVPSDDGTSFLPVYDVIDQVGVDLQYTKDAWLWKLETILRDGAADSFAAAVGGFEYTLYQVRESNADLGMLLEYQYDGRNEFEPITIADNDIFVATRYAANDAQDTTVLAGVSYDLDTGETFVNVEAERRFGADWFGRLRIRAFSGAEPVDVTYAMQQDDYVELSMSRYF